MTIDWTTTKKAIHDWVAAGTQVSASLISWAGQRKVQQPATGVWVSLRIKDDYERGHGWTTITERTSPAAGQELEYKAASMSVVTLEVSAKKPDATDSLEMVAVLRRLRAARSLPTQRSLLLNANIGLSSVDRIRSTDGIIQSTLIEARAMMDVRLNLSSELLQYITYIETVEISGEVDH